MTRPLLLDLFSGAGGAARGYQMAGFHVTGIDIDPQPRYAGDVFIQGDALNSPVELGAFDAIHASPPCQAYSVATRDKTIHADLVGAVRALLRATQLPYIIENVPGAPLVDAITLCGSSFGLRVRRHRLFESNIPLMALPCIHGSQGQPVGVYGEGTGTGQKRGRKVMSSDEAARVMEMPWATRAEATQAVPPAYTTFLGEQLLQALQPVPAYDWERHE